VVDFTQPIATTVPIAVRPAALSGGGSLTAAARPIHRVILRAVQGHGWTAIGERWGYLHAVAAVSLSYEDQVPNSVLLRIDSCQEAVQAVRDRLHRFGYSTEVLPQQDGVTTLRVGPGIDVGGDFTANPTSSSMPDLPNRTSSSMPDLPTRTSPTMSNSPSRGGDPD
jgi:hypothetical protein